MCCVVQLSTSSLVFTLSCFSFRMLLYTMSSQFSYCSSSSNSFPRSHFSHMFSLYSHGILGVVFTPPVGYSRLPSAVNDPTVTKQVNSGKSCLEEVSQLLIYQVSLINLYWVRLHGDFRRNKESTKFLASSTKTKNSFVSIFGFFELVFLLFLSTAAR